MSSRRDFIKTAGCLAVGFSLGRQLQAYPLLPAQELPRSLQRYPGINAWLEVLANGQVRVFTGKLELGQGIGTAIAQVAAEELDLGMEQVTVWLAETGRTPDEGYTAGSGSIEGSAMSVRYAAAAARQQLLELAARKLNIPASSLWMKDGKVSSGSRTLTFHEILDGQQLRGEIRPPIKLKPKAEYRLVGQPVHREDVRRMVGGQPVFVHDLRFPGMVHARVVRPPAYGAKLLQFDEQGVKAGIPGVIKTVVNGSFLAVIANGEYTAIQAQRWLQRHSRWSDAPPLPAVADSAALADHLRALPVRTEQVRNQGTVPQGNLSHSARYFKPYIMHGATGPSCAVALYEKPVLHVWTHSQGVYPLRATLQKMLNLPEEQIHVKGVPGSGCYGHNGADDVAAEAALIAMAYPGKHVRLQWSREEEHAWEPYGSAMIMEAAAQLDGSGRITHWRYALWSDTHSTRPGGRPENLLPAQYLEKPFTGKSDGFSGGAYRNGEPYYSIPNQQVHAHFFDGPLRVSALRSLGAYGNIFAIESFMDELAEKAGKDPYTFRLMHLDDERAKAVIRKVQAMAQETKAANTGIGMAFSRYKNSAAYCAVAAQVRVDPDSGQVQVQKMWAAVDAGEAINPDGLKNQTEGGMVQAASWALLEQVQFDQRHITSRSWVSYPIFECRHAPTVEVEVLNRPSERAMGAGEAAQGPAGAAIANAVYRACGKRIRYLPIQPALTAR